ncbi:hypothetical protein B0H10DRAFT_2219802 [Mycena sp. CBHHK59/15]|nr:hypothetical protein B0H10DRAFT_2219802 [Mycena sp. CBHHK59/15]
MRPTIPPSRPSSSRSPLSPPFRAASSHTGSARPVCTINSLLKPFYQLLSAHRPHRLQTPCRRVHAGAGLVFGTVAASPAAPAAALACNAALGQCSAICATVGLFAPTP